MASFQSAPVLVGVEQPQVCDEMGHVVAGRNGSAGAASAPDGWDIAAGYAARGQLETARNPGTSGINPPGPRSLRDHPACGGVRSDLPIWRSRGSSPARRSFPSQLAFAPP